MHPTRHAMLTAAALLLAAPAMAQVTFYEGEGHRGRAFTTNKTVPNLARTGFNDRASSAVVANGRWEVCENAAFQGRCVVLRQGSYNSLRGMGLDNQVSSMRPVNRRGRHANEAPEPQSEPDYAYRRRANERTFAVPVTSARAVMGTPEQRCWVERQQVPATSGGANIGAGIAGAVIGGILGHQIGGGSGRDIATVGGAVAGGAIGANVGRRGEPASERDVQRCETVASGPPQYWDVTYNFRGTEHRLQMASAPGPTITVNHNGEPRQ